MITFNDIYNYRKIEDDHYSNIKDLVWTIDINEELLNIPYRWSIKPSYFLLFDNNIWYDANIFNLKNSKEKYFDPIVKRNFKWLFEW